MNSYWVSVNTTWKIYAETPEEASEKFRRYYEGGEDPDTLDMVPKSTDIDSDWEME
jgi:hypothetical protein